MNRNIDSMSIKEHLLYNKDTGVFTWIKPTNHKIVIGSVAGTMRIGITGKTYRTIGLNGRLFYEHRLAWIYVHGKFPTHQIDHINGNGTDNRIVNLRAVTNEENQKNKLMRKDNASNITGVSVVKGSGKYLAQIQSNKKAFNLKSFDELWDAICARKSAEFKHGFHKNHGLRRSL